MAFGEEYYSVLVVSAAEKFYDVMKALLPPTQYAPVRFALSAAAARRACLERSYDFVIINAPLPDEFGTRFASQVCSGNSTVAAILVKGELCEEVRSQMVSEGIFTLTRPTSAQMITQALQWMAAARERLRRMESRAAVMEEKMEELRLVDRAKCLLIEHLNMTENDAHHCIEKQAMDRCVSRKTVALDIIRSYTQ